MGLLFVFTSLLRLLCATTVFLWAFVNYGFAAQEEEAPLQYPVETYAKLPFVFSPKLSPNGKFVAYISTAFSGRKSLLAHPVSGLEKGKTMFLPHVKQADISSFVWANDDVLLVTYSYYGPNSLYRSIQLEQTRLVAASLKDGSYNLIKASKDQKRKFRDSRTGQSSNTAFSAIQSNIVDLLPDDPEHILLAIDDDLDGDIDIRKIEVATGDYSVIQKGRKGIYRWLTDQNNEPALGYSVYAMKPSLFITREKQEQWSYDGIYALLENEAFPVEIYDDGNSALFSALNEHGRRSLGRFDLTNGALIEWVYSNPSYDIADIYQSDITRRVNGTGYYDTEFRQVFLSGKEKSVLKFVNESFPQASNTLISSDRGGNLWMVRSRTDRGTPKVFTVDWRAKRIAQFIDQREDIEDEDVAPVSMHTVTMRDGLEIEVYVTTPIGRGGANLPTVLLPHGGPWARDSSSFDVWAQFFANRGYLVLQPNFRGSTGYGVAFEDLGDQAWGAEMQDDLTDTVHWAVSENLTDEKRVCIVGGSYGGYAALMGVVKTPDQFQCAISINGVADVPLLWNDEANFLWSERMRELIGESRKNTKTISPYHRADEITKPVLLIAAKDDWRVNYKHSKKMYKRLRSQGKTVKYLQLKTGGHGVDVDAERILWFKAMDSFLAEHLR